MGLVCNDFQDWINLKNEKNQLIDISRDILKRCGIHSEISFNVKKSSNFVVTTKDVCLKIYTPDNVLCQPHYEYEKELFVLKRCINDCIPELIAYGNHLDSCLHYIITKQYAGISIDKFKSYDIQRKATIIYAILEAINSYRKLDYREIEDYLKEYTYTISHLDKYQKEDFMYEVDYNELPKLIHCDLKWDNILIDENDNIKIIDFGDLAIGPVFVDLAILYFCFVKKDESLTKYMVDNDKEFIKSAIIGTCCCQAPEEMIHGTLREIRMSGDMYSIFSDL